MNKLERHSIIIPFWQKSIHTLRYTHKLNYPLLRICQFAKRPLFRHWYKSSVPHSLSPQSILPAFFVRFRMQLLLPLLVLMAVVARGSLAANDKRMLTLSRMKRDMGEDSDQLAATADWDRRAMLRYLGRTPAVLPIVLGKDNQVRLCSRVTAKYILLFIGEQHSNYPSRLSRPRYWFQRGMRDGEDVGEVAKRADEGAKYNRQARDWMTRLG